MCSYNLYTFRMHHYLSVQRIFDLERIDKIEDKNTFFLLIFYIAMHWRPVRIENKMVYLNSWQLSSTIYGQRYIYRNMKSIFVNLCIQATHILTVERCLSIEKIIVCRCHTDYAICSYGKLQNNFVVVRMATDEDGI